MFRLHEKTRKWVDRRVKLFCSTVVKVRGIRVWRTPWPCHVLCDQRLSIDLPPRRLVPGWVEMSFDVSWSWWTPTYRCVFPVLSIMVHSAETDETILFQLQKRGLIQYRSFGSFSNFWFEGRLKNFLVCFIVAILIGLPVFSWVEIAWWRRLRRLRRFSSSVVKLAAQVLLWNRFCGRLAGTLVEGGKNKIICYSLCPTKVARVKRCNRRDKAQLTIVSNRYLLACFLYLGPVCVYMEFSNSYFSHRKMQSQKPAFSYLRIFAFSRKKCRLHIRFATRKFGFSRSIHNLGYMRSFIVCFLHMMSRIFV